jgi:formate/nitrite transporter FocA (FNT family)
MTALKTAGEILETVLEDGHKELDRASTGLAFSGFAAGLNISFGAVAVGVVGAVTGGTGLVAMLFYPIGFLIVMLGRGQLFTTNTVTPVTVVLDEKLSNIPNMLRLWAVIFIFNILGTVVFAAVVVYGKVLSPTALELLFDEVTTKLEYGFWITALKAVFGGWLVALMVWLAASATESISQAFFIYALALIIPVGGLTHCIAGSSEVLMSVLAGEASVTQYLGLFLIPTTLGNIVGGVVLVALLNYAQVAGSEGENFLAGNTEGDRQEKS